MIILIAKNLEEKRLLIAFSCIIHEGILIAMISEVEDQVEPKIYFVSREITCVARWVRANEKQAIYKKLNICAAYRAAIK